MGRGSRFGFSMRKSNASKNVVIEQRVPIVRIDGSISTSKAEKLLGHSGLVMASSSGTPSHERNGRDVPRSIAESAYEPEATPYESTEKLVLPPRIVGTRPSNSSRASSHALGVEDYTGTSSVGTSTAHYVSHKESSSTIRSYYDSKRTPLLVSQQTSDSAVRDMALRKGHSPVQISRVDEDTKSTISGRGSKLEKEKSTKKPSRLDLTKLFPKPRAHERVQNVLQSPNKFVDSPTQMSITSDLWSRENSHVAKSLKSKVSTESSLRKASPNVRSADPLENAKTNIRKPPKGVKHWFDALSSEEDDLEDEIATKSVPIRLPQRKSSLGRVLVNGQVSHWEEFQTHGGQDPAWRDSHRSGLVSPKQQKHEHQPRQPSRGSLSSHITEASAKTKESTMSQVNLRTTSALSMSSSDSEDDSVSVSAPNPTPVRESLISTSEGEIIIGRAQAFEIVPNASRHPSTRSKDSRISALTSSSKAGTIQMVYSPVPPLPPIDHAFSQHANFSSYTTPSRDQSTSRDVQVRPRTSGAEISAEREGLRSESESIHSSKSAKSEPRSREGHKLMAVTREEEALLEMMRQKRAAMAKQSFSQGYQTAIGMGRLSRQALNDKTARQSSDETESTVSDQLLIDTPAAELIDAFPVAPTPITSTFFPDSASPSPQRVQVLQNRSNKHRPSRIITSSVNSSPDATRGVLRNNSMTASMASSFGPKNFSLWRDSVASEVSNTAVTAAYNHVDPFPSPCNTSIASATSVSHPSPLPSPATPGAEEDIRVRVASSEPSLSGDEEAVIPPHSIVDFASPRSSVGGALSEKGSQSTLSGTYRSAGSRSPRDYPLENVLDLQAIPIRTASRRTNASTLSSRSIVSNRSSSFRESKLFRSANRDSLGPSVNTRCSVSEDVLAAWGSLGGWRDYDTSSRRPRI